MKIYQSNTTIIDKYKSVLTAVLILLLSYGNIFVQGQENEITTGNKSETIHFKSTALFRCNISLPANFNPDQAAKYELGVKSKEVLNRYGYDVTFHTFEGEHTIDTEGLNRALEWLSNGEKD